MGMKERKKERNTESLLGPVVNVSTRTHTHTCMCVHTHTHTHAECVCDAISLSYLLYTIEYNFIVCVEKFTFYLYNI